MQLNGPAQSSAGEIGIACDLGGDRQQLAAVEPEVAQDARIERAQGKISGPGSLAAPEVGRYTASEVSDGLQRRCNDLRQAV